MIAGTRELGHCIKGGVVAGVVGGVVISLFMLIANVLTGQDVWGGMKFAGAPFLGERALQPGFDAPAVLVGLLSHFAVSIAWAIPFALLAYGLTRGLTLAAGALWGFLVWLGMFYVALPALGLGPTAEGGALVMAIVQHLAYGLGVGAGFLPYQRPVSRRRGYAAA
jgi:hypothetical protein